MKFGIQYNSAYYGVDPDVIAGYAKQAEDSGFESIFMPEHVVLYPGATLGLGSLPGESDVLGIDHGSRSRAGDR